MRGKFIFNHIQAWFTSIEVNQVAIGDISLVAFLADFSFDIEVNSVATKQIRFHLDYGTLKIRFTTIARKDVRSVRCPYY